MGEHATNSTALFTACLPPLMEMGEPVAIDFQAVVMPKPNILLLPAKDIGENGTKIRLPGHEDWIDTPEGGEAFELGKRLPPEKCDVVIAVGTAVRGKQNAVAIAGQTAQARISKVSHMPLCRISLDQWRAEHYSNLESGSKGH